MPILQSEIQTSSILNFKYFICLLDKGTSIVGSLFIHQDFIFLINEKRNFGEQNYALTKKVENTFSYLKKSQFPIK